jgi:acetyl-CoA carboxylase biotin carboxyl carrier protein
VAISGSRKKASVNRLKEDKDNNNHAINTQDIQTLVKLVADNDLTELTIDNGQQKIVIKRERAVTQVITEAVPSRSGRGRGVNPSVLSPALMPNSMPIHDPGAPPEDSFHKITAPMVGTFYRTPEPNARNFVSEGEIVEKDQVIGIIEAMKIMNEIKSEHRGRCVKISVENSQPVEYGQTLLLLEPV